MNFITGLGCILLAVIIHELGHITALSLYGYRIKTVYIGLPLKPALVFTLNIGRHNAKVCFTPYIWGGHTSSDMDRKPSGLTWFLIIFAGSFANILVLIPVYLIRGLSDFAAVISALTSSELHQLTFLFWFVALNVAVGIGSLIPFISSDGNELIKVFRGQRYFEK